MDAWDTGNNPLGGWLPDLSQVTLDELLHSTDPELTRQVARATAIILRQIADRPEPEITYWPDSIEG